MLPTRASPQLKTASSSLEGQWSSSHSKPALDQRRPDAVGRHPVVVGPLPVDVVAQRAPAVVGPGQEGGRAGRPSARAGRPAPRRLGARGAAGRPVPPRRTSCRRRCTGSTSGGTMPSTRSMTKKGTPMTSVPVLQPEDLGDRHLGVVGHHLHGQELALHVVGREHRVGRRVRARCAPPARGVSASPGTVRSNSTVSDDIPFDSGTTSSDTVAPGTRSAATPPAGPAAGRSRGSMSGVVRCGAHRSWSWLDAPRRGVGGAAPGTVPAPEELADAGGAPVVVVLAEGTDAVERPLGQAVDRVQVGVEEEAEPVEAPPLRVQLRGRSRRPGRGPPAVG